MVDEKQLRLANTICFLAMQVIDTGTGEELGPNQNGELCFRGPQVMLGYINNKKQTDLTIQNGWLHTGNDLKRDLLEHE